MSLWAGNTENNTPPPSSHSPPGTAQWLGGVKGKAEKHSTVDTHHNVTGSGSVTVTWTCVPLSVTVQWSLPLVTRWPLASVIVSQPGTTQHCTQLCTQLCPGSRAVNRTSRNFKVPSKEGTCWKCYIWFTGPFNIQQGPRRIFLRALWNLALTALPGSDQWSQVTFQY